MLGHLSFGVSDLKRSIAFYDAALAPLGLVHVWTNPLVTWARLIDPDGHPLEVVYQQKNVLGD
jgi:catechol 2,3-dioxygenase-like lactoylglutathione lyase family enzyme